MKATARTFHASMPPPPSPLTGLVHDARTGAPLPRAHVAATPARDLLARGAGRRQASFSATAADGTFTVRLERTGVLLLAVHAPGYLPALVPVSSRRSHVRIALARGADLAGEARDARGAPRAGATVRALCPAPLDAAEARTDARGRFSLRGLRPGAWRVHVEGEEASAVEVELSEGGAGEVVLAP